MKPFFRHIAVLALLLGLPACGPTLAERKADADIHYRLGSVHLGDGNYTEALKELTDAVALSPKNPAFHNALGLAYFYKDLSDKAVFHLKKAVELKPDFSEAHVNLAAVYIKQKKWDLVEKEASTALDNVFYRTPETAHFNIGVARYNTGRYDEALTAFKKALEANQAYALAYYNMGLVYEKLHKNREAAAVYEKAVRIAPGYIDAYLKLGMTRVKLNDREGAATAFKRVVDIAPGTEAARSAREYLELIK
ncbi:MAG: tetratricopeptide repeat protein [Thermodesulfobacteriota bacterium]